MDTLFYEQLCSEEKSIQEQLTKLTHTLEAVRVLKDRYRESFTPVSTKPRQEQLRLIDNKFKEFPVKYDKELNQHQKIYIALLQLKEGLSADIAAKLHQLEPDEYPIERAIKVAREKASDLYVNGVFGAKRLGNKNKYFIKQ